jgi:hypothetical protein
VIHSCLHPFYPKIIGVIPLKPIHHSSVTSLKPIAIDKKYGLSLSLMTLDPTTRVVKVD